MILYTEITLFLGFMGFFSATVLQAVLAPWYRSITGRALMVFNTSVTLALGITIALHLTGVEGWWQLAWTGIVTTLVMASGWLFTGLIIGAQLRGHRDSMPKSVDELLFTKERNSDE